RMRAMMTAWDSGLHDSAQYKTAPAAEGGRGLDSADLDRRDGGLAHRRGTIRTSSSRSRGRMRRLRRASRPKSAGEFTFWTTGLAFSPSLAPAGPSIL